MDKFAGVRQLFARSGKAAATENDDHSQNDAGATGATAGPTEAQVNQLVAEEADKARTAANDRWNTVMTSDAGAANPKAAARLLMAGGGTMSADDIVATLGDIGPAAATTPTTPGQTAQSERQQQLASDAEALANDRDANPRTGAAGSRPGVRTGEGEDKDRSARTQARKARQEKRNAQIQGNPRGSK